MTTRTKEMSARPSCVVIGSTLSEAGDRVVDAGVRLARTLGATVHLVHAFDVPLVMTGGPFEPVAYDLPPQADELAALGRERMEEQIERLNLPGVTDAAGIVRHVIQGPAHRVICDLAVQQDAALIVVGAADTIASHAFGSTASRVVRKTSCPVLVLRGGLALPPERVLIPADLSPISGEVLTRALPLLEQLGCMPDRAHGRRGSMIEAFHVVVPAGYEGFVPRFDLAGVEREGAAKLAAFLSANAGDSWGISARCAFGGAREEVLARIAACHPNLVVMGTHGRSGFERFMLGSVAESVVRSCHTSVLVVPPQAARAAAGAPAAGVLAAVAPAPRPERTAA
jgi:nucleotide-binding universal stress UspA family protein